MAATQAELTAARRWISRGGRPPFDLPVLADTCDQLVRGSLATSLRPALRLSRRYYAQAVRVRSHELRLSALRNLARGLHMSGNHREALTHYRAAAALAMRANRKLDAARIERALADVLMYLNRYAAAEQACRKSARDFRRLGAPADAIQSEVNLANLLHRQDRHLDAAAIYKDALTYFETSGPPLALARVSYNLGNTLVQMFQWEDALACFLRAESIYHENECRLDANDARYGRAYIDLLGDRFAHALDELSACERVYSEEADPRGQALCHLDMAEAYLGLNLFNEAYLKAVRAERLFARLKLRYERAKGRLYKAYALAGLGRKALALRVSRAAAKDFEQEGNRGMSAAVMLLQARLAATSEGRKHMLHETRKLFRRAQLSTWATHCDLQILAESARPGALASRLESNAAVRRVPHWSALLDSIWGEHHYRSGNTEAARSRWTKAARTLEGVRAGLPPIEMRTAYMDGRHDPYRKLIALDAATHSESAAVWAERLKTAGMWSLDLHAFQSDPDAKALLAQWHDLVVRLSALARSVPSAKGRRPTTVTRAAEQRMKSLERQSRQLLRTIESKALRLTSDTHDIGGAMLDLSARIPIVLWHDTGRDLIAFVMQNRKTVPHFFPKGTERLQLELQRWRFFMERHMISPQSTSGAGVEGSEASYWQEFGNWLWKPLDLSLGAGTPVLVIPDRALFALPFAALRPDANWLGDQASLIVSPSVRHYLNAERMSTPDSGFEILDAGTEELGATRLEVETISRLLGTREHHVHRPAMRETLLNLGPARVWHYAGHAQHRADNPFYSSLQLHDAPVFAVDLRTRRVPVKLATLSACHSAGGASAPGEEFSGMVRSFLEMGARSVIAALWPVADESAAFWMSAFYERWLDGRPLTQSISEAQAETRRLWPSPYHWSAFTLFGAEN